jgi:hypothetical protein
MIAVEIPELKVTEVSSITVFVWKIKAYPLVGISHLFPAAGQQKAGRYDQPS